MIPRPRRRHRVVIDVHADTLDGLKSAIENWLDELHEEIPRQSELGGASCGATFTHTIDTEQTHDRYAAQLDAWLEAKRGGQ